MRAILPDRRPPTGHVRGRLGTIDYRAADVGLDADELRERFAPYVARFLA